MFKKITAVFLVLVMLFVSIEAEASAVVSDSLATLALSAQRYYNTKVAYCDMTVSRVKDNLYEFYYFDKSGKGTTTRFYLTDWGTWNLGDMSVSDGTTEKVVIGGATDWEYVFRIYDPISQNSVFSGGNHGSEVLNSMVMYDAVTGEVFSLEKGESKYVNRLVIEENTTLLLGNVDYLPYAEVKRVYTVVGNTINLDCTIKFIRDVRMSLSYTAMASVNKDFGRYCSFDDETFVRTVGKGNTSNEHLGNTSSMVCHLSGDDPMASVSVGIYNKKDMTDDFSNRDKTFLWDMTKDFNKVYFSKYNMTELKVITSGTVWDFGTYWKVNL